VGGLGTDWGFPCCLWRYSTLLLICIALSHFAHSLWCPEWGRVVAKVGRSLSLFLAASHSVLNQTLGASFFFFFFFFFFLLCFPLPQLTLLGIHGSKPLNLEGNPVGICLVTAHGGKEWANFKGQCLLLVVRWWYCTCIRWLCLLGVGGPLEQWKTLTQCDLPLNCDL
jgi:hypothetical protein